MNKWKTCRNKSFKSIRKKWKNKKKKIYNSMKAKLMREEGVDEKELEDQPN
jgi:hypothetical protein